jgi:hypothetical protein
LAVAPLARAVAQDVVEPQDTAGAELLRSQIEQRIAERVKVELNLNDDQMRKLRATQERFGPRRRALARERMGYALGLQGQMRPGIAANPDSVRVYMDGLQRIKAGMLALDQEEDREWAGYLTPVQRARLQMIRQRVIDRVNQLRLGRQNRFGGERPIQRPPRGRIRRP